MAQMDDEELCKNILSISKEQIGCRFIQNKMDENPHLANGLLFKQVIQNLFELCNDPFGNYFIQKLVESLNVTNLKIFISNISKHFIKIATNTYGTRVIQKLIDVLKTPELVNNFILLFQPFIILLIKDNNGNHIIQNFFLKIKENNQFLFDVFIEKYLIICLDKHGCVLMQKCIECANDENRKKLLNLIIRCTSQLIIDMYGNFVIQFIVSLKNFEINLFITNCIIPNILNLSKQKFSSNVIEKIFESSNEIIQEILIKNLANTEMIQSLIFDIYGNYVVQKALSLAKENYFIIFVEAIVPMLDRARSVPFGLKLYQKLIKTYPIIQNYLMQYKSNVNNKNSINYNINNNTSPINNKIGNYEFLNKKYN